TETLPGVRLCPPDGLDRGREHVRVNRIGPFAQAGTGHIQQDLKRVLTDVVVHPGAFPRSTHPRLLGVMDVLNGISWGDNDRPGARLSAQIDLIALTCT